MSIEWVQSRLGDTERATLRIGMVLEVGPASVATRTGPPPKFMVYLFGMPLKARLETKDEAKAFAEAVAKRWLAEALAKFD